MELHKILPHLASTYKSVDLGIACAFYEDKWFNLLTLLRFTHEDTVLLNKQISENQNLMQLGKGSKFRIYRKPMELTDLSQLTENFLKGSITLNDITIHYDSAIDVQNFDLSFIEGYPRFYKEWGTFCVYRFGNNKAPYKRDSFYDSLKGDVIRYGAKDIFEAIKRAFDLKEYGRTSVADFILDAPVYARIEDIDLEGRKLKIASKYHTDLRDLVLHYGKYRYTPNREEVSKPDVYDQKDGITTKEGDFRIWQIKADEIVLDESYENIACEATLFFQPLNQQVSSILKYITHLLAKEKLLQSNPLAKIFAKFCPIEKLEQMLTNPIKVPESGFQLSDSSNFERAVQWLFTLHGFQAVWLGKDTETIRDEQNRPTGSTDLLCYSAKEKALAIVSCKTGIPDYKDVDLIKNLADKFRKDVEELSIRVVPIIVSSQPCDTVRQISSQNSVDIIDVNDIKRIVTELYEVPPTPGLLLRTIRTSSTIGL